MYYGGGGFTYNDVYHMPTPHRRFQLDKLLKVRTAESNQVSKQKSAPNFKKK